MQLLQDVAKGFVQDALDVRLPQGRGGSSLGSWKGGEGMQPQTVEDLLGSKGSKAGDE
jgi:hypothetical protein